MIWELLVNLITLPMKLIMGIFPPITIPYFSDASTTTAQSIGSKLGAVNAILPMTESLGLVAFALGVVLPMAGAYTIANWIWRHIPTIFGVGTGAG